MGNQLCKIKDLLIQRPGWSIQKCDDCLRITNEDGIDAYVAISGIQILVESLLFAKNDVRDATTINDEILNTHQLFPLTAIGITKIDKEDYYMAFGALSTGSSEDSILTEVENLFNNVPAILQAYEDHIH